MKERETPNGRPDADADPRTEGHGSAPIETRAATIWLADEIIHIVMHANAELALEDAIQVVSTCEQLCAGRRRPMVTDIRQLRSVTREARQHYAQGEFQRNCLAAGVVIGSPVSRVIGNMFLGLNKTAWPTKLFTSEPDALRWLRGFLD